MPTTQKIKETLAYQNLPNIVKDIVKKRKNLLEIIRHVNIARHIGIDVWKKQFNSSWTTLLIVEELVKDC